jgi:hypothetical protein
MQRTWGSGGGGRWGTPGARPTPLPGAAALPRAFRRPPDLARDVAECLLVARRRGAHLTPDDAYWLARLRRRGSAGADDRAAGA